MLAKFSRYKANLFDAMESKYCINVIFTSSYGKEPSSKAFCVRVNNFKTTPQLQFHIID